MGPTSPWSRCTAQKPSGEFCDAQSLPDAPFPICVRHAAQLYEFLQRTVHDRFQHLQVDAGTVQAQMEIAGQSFPEDRAVIDTDPVVYYIRVGESIKIGTSADLSNRIRSYPPTSVLLATEPGGVEVERQRLDEFRLSRHAGREWFTPSAALVAHINELRALADQEPIAG